MVKTICGVPISEEGMDILVGQEPLLAPGVRGYAIEGEDGSVYIPLVIAEREGSGDVGRFLDSLDPSVNWKFTSVISLRLAGMLERRGYERKTETLPGIDDSREIVFEVWSK